MPEPVDCGLGRGGPTVVHPHVYPSGHRPPLRRARWTLSGFSKVTECFGCGSTGSDRFRPVLTGADAFQLIHWQTLGFSSSPSGAMHSEFRFSPGGLGFESRLARFLVCIKPLPSHIFGRKTCTLLLPRCPFTNKLNSFLHPTDSHLVLYCLGPRVVDGLGEDH
jgi:hypothetical protein